MLLVAGGQLSAGSGLGFGRGFTLSGWGPEAGSTQKGTLRRKLGIGGMGGVGG